MIFSSLQVMTDPKPSRLLRRSEWSGKWNSFQSTSYCLAGSHSHILLRNHSDWRDKGGEKCILIYVINRLDSTAVLLGYHAVS
jgi:hypothetical protein